MQSDTDPQLTPNGRNVSNRRSYTPPDALRRQHCVPRVEYAWQKQAQGSVSESIHRAACCKDTFNFQGKPIDERCGPLESQGLAQAERITQLNQQDGMGTGMGAGAAAQFACQLGNAEGPRDHGDRWQGSPRQRKYSFGSMPNEPGSSPFEIHKPG
jgi:hypothetical protein